ncbi:hypothetical protein EG329_004901 [Mollisiaceae sp. DMI_Dod_QoI]|nr:hypothetical protein EG329_004901 [Helotiales sp. DMI_Dod_QoI]
MFGVIITEVTIILAPYLLLVTGIWAWSSRKRESEADYIGLAIMAKAGYDIRKATDFWKRVKRDTDPKLAERDTIGNAKYPQKPEFLSSHPHDRSRINNIRAWLPQIVEQTCWVPPLGRNE